MTVEGEPSSDASASCSHGEHAAEQDEVEDLQDYVHQLLFSVVMQVTDCVANGIACNSPANGLEAWRKLIRRLDPLTGGRDVDAKPEEVHEVSGQLH